MKTEATSVATKGAGIVLLTLAAGQFLMTLDSSVMNVSIATVAQDVGTTVTGIQTAITLYTLVMAMLMITGGKVGSMIGRKRAFAIGCVIYGCGSLTTSLAKSLGVLIFGWSFLEGVGAALIMPAIVALVAANFRTEERPRAYGLVAAAGAVAVAVGPLIGGLATTYASWRWVFAGEVLVVIVILLLSGKIADAPVERRPHLDIFGAILSALGLGLAVFGVLRSSEWGFVLPKPDGPSIGGVSPTIVFISTGILVLWFFIEWERRRERLGQEPLIQMSMLQIPQLKGGLIMFFFQFLIQAGVFFVIPLYLSVALGLSAIDTGLRIMPLSITLLAAAVGVPRYFPGAPPRLVVRIGVLAMVAGIVALLTAIDVEAGPEIVTIPLLLVGLGIGALASQLGAVTVSAVPDDQSPEVGGLQNTATNLGASIGVALAGSFLIVVLTTSFLTGIQGNPAVPNDVSAAASVNLASGIPFVSDAQLSQALADANVPPETSQAIVSENEQARLDGLKAALSILAALSLLALFSSRRIPAEPLQAAAATA
jgi:MFS family permease